MREQHSHLEPAEVVAGDEAGRDAGDTGQELTEGRLHQKFSKKVGNFHDLGGGGGSGKDIFPIFSKLLRKNVPHVAKSLNN